MGTMCIQQDAVSELQEEGKVQALSKEITYPPVGMVQRERELLHHTIGMVGAMRRHLRARRETAETEIEVRTHRALDANRCADVSLAEVAVV